MNSFGVLVARLISGLRNRRIPPAMTESNAFYKLSFIHLSLFFSEAIICFIWFGAVLRCCIGTYYI